MRSLLPLTLLLLAVTPCCALAQDHTTAAAARWSFSHDQGSSPRDAVSGAAGKLEGKYQYVPGVSGEGLRFDGYTTGMTVSHKEIPPLGAEGFSVEAWLALDTYPWNWVPVAAQESEHQAGFFLGLDAFGHVAFAASINGQWRTAVSATTVPLKRWTHLAGTYATRERHSVLTVWINGVSSATVQAEGEYTPARTNLLIGRVARPMLPFPEAEVKPPQAVWYSLDGIVDEVALYARPQTAEELAQEIIAANAPRGEVLPWQKMPSGPAGPGRFGAYYTTLRYEDAWERLRQIGPNADVVVRFDESPSRLVFWQGTNYVPAWVSGDDKWYTDEFLEVWDAGCPDGGDCEPMSDKQSRTSHVEILESNEARAVVHWRYALTEAVGSKGAWPETRTGWTDWADEYWTIYPDGVAVRKQVLHSSNVRGVHEWQETIVLHQPGSRPEDDIENDAITLGNMDGATETYTWQPHRNGAFTNPHGPGEVTGPPHANMQMVNTKSTWRPFQIVPPEGVSADFYNNEKSYFTFECWNHWPVAQIASSDRPCVTNDRPSHSSLSHLFWKTSAETEDTATKILMDGLTAKTLPELAPLARSWTAPPPFEVAGEGVRGEGYDASQRAYVLRETQPGRNAPVRLTFRASEASPIFHVALLVQGWGEQAVRVHVDGRPVKPNSRLRVAYLPHLERMDLLLWLEEESMRPMEVELTPLPHGNR